MLTANSICLLRVFVNHFLKIFLKKIPGRGTARETESFHFGDDIAGSAFDLVIDLGDIHTDDAQADHNDTA